MREELQEFLHLPAWEYISAHLSRRREEALKSLITSTDDLVIRRRQCQVQEIDLLLQLPRQLLQEELNKEKNDEIK
jgi:hypothetical protein